MKKNIIIIIASLLTVVSLYAQSNLAGRKYHNANIMAKEMNERFKDTEKKMVEARSEAIAKIEKEKGRKPTDAEIAEIDKKLVEGQKKIDELKKGITASIMVEFKNEQDIVLKNEMKINDEILKAAGVSWLKRKAMKAALAIAPSTHKSKYTVNGNLIIFKDDDEQDTLRLSDDGKYLFGKFDKKMNFKLTRIK